ncbi:hypothetical protein MKW92_048222, partial [Papaver armeniacum]
MSTEEVKGKESSVETGGYSSSYATSLGVRKLLFWTVFVAAIVVHTSKQTVDDYSYGSKTTKYIQEWKQIFSSQSLILRCRTSSS